MKEINKALLSVKLTLFCWFGALSSAQIFMSIYLKSFGINAQTFALLAVAHPLSRVLGPSIIGPIADKMGQYKSILYISFSVQILTSICFLFIPPLQDNRKLTTPICTQQIVCCPNNTNLEDSVLISSNESLCYSCSHGCSENEILKLHNESHHTCQLQENETINQLWYSVNSSCYATNSTENICFVNDTKSLNCSSNETYVDVKLIAVLICYCIHELSIGVTYAMVDATVLAMVKLHNGNYGKQHVWAIVGMSILSPVSGFLVDYVSAKKGCTDYSPAFYIFNVLTIINIISVFSMNLKYIPPSQRLLRDLYNRCTYKVWLFLSSLFFHGIFYGYIETYLFWYLHDLGSPKYLMGLTLTFIGICALPLSYISKRLIDKFGCAALITVAFFTSSVCNLAYSYLRNPWIIVIVEMPNSSFYHLMWITVATYNSQLVPSNLLASIQSAAVMSHYGLGRGAGAFIGGNLIHCYGDQVSFRCMGISAGIVAGIYSILYYRSEKSSQNCQQLKYSANGSINETSQTNLP